MSSILDRMKSWVNRNADHFVVHFIPAADAPPLVAHQSYLRLWLTDMFLKRDREWFENQYPMVHATVQLTYAGRTASFSSLARAPEGRLGPGDRRNYPLTPLLPWSGGVVEIEAGLSALPGKNLLAPALDVLQQVSRLVAPPLSSALAVADQVGAAIDGLLSANNEPVVLGLHDAFATQGGGARALQPGHFAVVAKRPAELKAEALSVVASELHVTADGATRQLTDADYLLVEVSSLRERDDWRFPALEELIAKAVEAVVGGNQDDYERYRTAALTMALTASDLTPVDRQRVARAVRDELTAAAGAGEGAVPAESSDLETIVASRAPSLEEASAAPRLTLDELLAGE
jgi:hypothetical protein